MGSCFSQEGDDSEVIKFVDLNDDDPKNEELVQPRIRKKRQQTDQFFLILMGTFLLIFVCFMGYCSSFANVNRILRGYDQCGNVCGDNNPKTSSGFNRFMSCDEQDMRKKPYLVEGNCVESCESKGYKTLLYRCIKEKFEVGPVTHELANDLSITSGDFLQTILIAQGLIIVIILLLRYFVGVFIWCLLIGGSIGAILLSCILWRLYLNERYDPALKVLAIVVSIITFIIVMVIIALRKRIKLIIQLFKEGSKALGAIPHLLLQPVLTFAASFVSLLIYVYCEFVLFSAGSLSKIGNNYEFVGTDVVVLTQCLLKLMFYWLTFFFLGCQDMIVGGAIATWYFSRNKTRLDSPIWRSMVNLVRYHLGSVALGSLIMVIMLIVKKIFNFIRKRCRHASCCCCCLCCCLGCFFETLERFISYFTKLSYIATAMYGVPFCRGGQQVIKLFANNGGAILKLNSIGTFILFLIKLLIVAVTTIISSVIIMEKSDQLTNPVIPIALSGVIAYILATCFLSVYSTAIDTIFICFCEDSELNDGVTRPFYMSKELMRFVDHSNDTLDYIEANFNTAPVQNTQQNEINMQQEVLVAQRY